MNYYECSSSSNKILFFFVDNSQCLANVIFASNKLKAKCLSEIQVGVDGYKITFVRISKKQKELFISCMEELNNEMLSCGYLEYPKMSACIVNNRVLYKYRVKARG